MKDLGHTLQEALSQKLASEGYDLDLVPIPVRGDRMVRIRTLEEALDDFDSATDAGESIGYLVQVRPRGLPRPAPHPLAPPSPTRPPDAGLDEGDDGEFSFSRLVDETFSTTPRRTSREVPEQPRKPALDGIYLPNGKLNVPFLIENGNLLFKAGEHTLARNIFRTVLQSGERSGLAHYWIGRCFESEGKLEEARSHYEESIAYHPTIEACQHFAAILIRDRKDHEAAEALERALALKELDRPTRFELHKACGNCWLRAGRPEDARRHYLAAAELEPASDSILCNLGALHMQLGETAEAKRRFQEALAANPRSDKALAGMGSCLLAEGDKRGAHDAFARSLDLQLNNPTAVYHLVKCAYEIKSYATAARIVGEYVQSAPVNANLLYSLGGLQFHLGRMEEARATAEQVTRIQPGHAGAAELLNMIERYSSSAP